MGACFAARGREFLQRWYIVINLPPFRRALQDDSFIMFMRQIDWMLSENRQQDEFAKLTDIEIHALEITVRKSFEGREEHH